MGSSMSNRSSFCCLHQIKSERSFNHGQTCCAGSRIYVHANIYDEFLRRFTEKSRALKVGDPFAEDSFQGPQVSETHFNVSAAVLIAST